MIKIFNFHIKKLHNETKAFLFSEIFANLKKNLNSHEKDLPQLRKMKLQRNEQTKYLIKKQIQKINFIISREKNFSKPINFQDLVAPMKRNFDIFLEESENLGFFLTLEEFCNFLKIIRKSNLLESHKKSKINDFSCIYINYFSNFLDGDIKSIQEIFHLMRNFVYFFGKMQPKFDKKEKLSHIFTKIKSFYFNTIPLKKIHYDFMITFLGFVKCLGNQFDIKIIENVIVEMFQKQNLNEIITKPIFNLWKLEISSVLKNKELFSLSPEEIKHDFMSFSSENPKKLLNYYSSILKRISKIEIIPHFYCYLSQIICEFIEKIDKIDAKYLKNELSLHEKFSLLLIIKKDLLENEGLKKQIILRFLNYLQTELNNEEFSLEPKAIDYESSNWLYNSQKNCSIDVEIAKLLIANFHKMNLQSLIFCIFLHNHYILDFVKYETYLYSCIKTRFFLKDNSVNNKEFFEIFPLLINEIHEKKQPIFYEIFAEIFEERIRNISKIEDLNEFFTKISIFLNYLENHRLESQLDNAIVDKLLINNIKLDENLDLFENIFKMRYLKLFDFFRTSFEIIKKQFNQIEFSHKIYYLYALANIFPKHELTKFLDEFKKEFDENNINSLKFINDFYRVFYLLVYMELSEIVEKKLIIQLFYHFFIFLQKLELKISFNTSLLKRFDNIFTILLLCLCEENQQIILKKIKNRIEELFKDNDSYIENLEKRPKVNRFEGDFIKNLKLAYPEIKIKNNFYLFENEFECDIWIENENILVELFGPSHFLNNNLFELNSISFKILEVKKKQLSPKKIVIIPYFEWNNLAEGAVNEKIEYIKKTIKI